MVYLNKITGEEPVVVKQDNKGAVQKAQNKVVVPVGQKTEKKSDEADKLPQGYYVEKSQDAPAATPTEAPVDEVNDNSSHQKPNSVPMDNNDVDEPDTNVYPGARITVDNIALEQSDKIDEALAGAEMKGLNSATEESASKFDKALTMIQADPHSVLEPNFKKGFHGNGLARYELTNYSVSADTEFASLLFKRSTDTKRVDFSGTYESPKGNTKLMFYASGTSTSRHVKTVSSIEYSYDIQDIPDDMDNPEIIADGEITNEDVGNEEIPTEDVPAEDVPTEEIPAEEVTESREKINQYRLYLGGKFKLGKDELSASIMHAKGASLDNSNTTEIDARYYINNYNLSIDGSTIIYKIGDRSSTKTNFSCYFNAKDQANQTENEPQAESETADENKTKPINTGNKWSSRGGLIIKGESVDGEYEQGIGYYRNFKRLGDEHSMLKITPFVVGSTTPRKEEKSSYHVLTGVNVKYNKKFSPDSELSASLDLKNRVTFSGNDKGNIFTAFVDADYSYKKINAKLEGKYITVPDSKYLAFALRGAYKANKHLLLFGETSYIDQKTGLIGLKGGSFSAGANVVF